MINFDLLFSLGILADSDLLLYFNCFSFHAENKFEILLPLPNFFFF